MREVFTCQHRRLNHEILIIALFYNNLSESDKERILRMADADGAIITNVEFESDTLGGEGASSNHGYFTITGMTVQYESATVTLSDGIWTVIQ